jgi:hypothetical protein
VPASYGFVLVRSDSTGFPTAHFEFSPLDGAAFMIAGGLIMTAKSA